MPLPNGNHKLEAHDSYSTNVRRFNFYDLSSIYLSKYSNWTAKYQIDTYQNDNVNRW